MEGVPVTLLEFVDEDGRNPFREWLHGLRDVQARARIRVRLNRLRLGNFGDARSVGAGVSELRVPHGPGYRVYFAKPGQVAVLLLCGGDKATQHRDIVKARQLWAEYQRRT